MKLYVVGTPIGNLGDFSPRGLQALKDCDFIAAEDTRVTAKLLHRFGIAKAMVSYHEHNRRQSGAQILQRLLAGESCALVTDAGMPAISDPGEDLICACHEAGVPVESVPGPTAFATALALSGMPSGRFCFEGFLSVNRRSRKEHLDALEGEQRTMIFYEAPHKLPATLQELARRFGDRPLAIVREITKLHEEVIRTDCLQAARDYAEGGLKGEIVLILAGAVPPPEEAMGLEEAAALARELIAKGAAPTEAAKRAAAASGRKKTEIYSQVMKEN